MAAAAGSGEMAEKDDAFVSVSNPALANHVPDGKDARPRSGQSHSLVVAPAGDLWSRVSTI